MQMKSSEDDRLSRHLKVIETELGSETYEVLRPFLHLAFIQRTARRGYLQRNPPPRAFARAIWAVLQPNHHKVGERGVAAVLQMDDPKLKAALGEAMARNWPVSFDIDAEQLTEMGVW
jgi:hypothetical protein